jgi:hypothetical protein
MVELVWETVSERNNQFFDVERSRTGEIFETVVRVEGAGNSTSLRKYTAVDTYPYSGLSYYRLRQQDFDGTLSYSNVIRVEVASAYSIFAHPNPFDGNALSINWRDGKPGDMMFIRLWTQNGAEAFNGETLLNQDLNAHIKFGEPLSAGLYLVEISTQEGVQRLKVMVK